MPDRTTKGRFLTGALLSLLLVGGVAAASAFAAGGPSGAGHGPDATGPAMGGLCNAWLHGGGQNNPDAPPFRNLLAAAGAAHLSVQAFCAGATTTVPPTTTASGT